MKSITAIERCSTSRTAVLIAHEYLVARMALKEMVREHLGTVDFVEADDGDSLSRALKVKRAVCLAFVDIDMPQMRGRRLAEWVHRYPKILFVALSASDPAKAAREMLDVPTRCSVITKEADIPNIRRAIEEATRRTQLTLAPSPRGSSQQRNLSRRQARQDQIRYLLSCGMSNKVIAATLGVSHGTVKNQVTDIFKMLKVANRLQAARHFIRARK